MPMSEYGEKGKRIAKNSLFLYCRSFVTMVISLYTSRLVLEALGVVDYGIYSLIGSIVVMFSMFSATFSSATQRFLNVEMARGTEASTREVFTVSQNIHLVMAMALLLLFETVGLWGVNTQLSIPEGRMTATNVVYHCTVMSFLVGLVCIPFNAAVIAHEKMGVLAMVSICEAVAKLLLAFYIKNATNADALEIYAVVLMAISIGVGLFYWIYCYKRFVTCHRVKVVDKSCYKSLLGISGWNFLGSSASIITVQGASVILNLFVGVVANTSKGIAQQVEHVVKQLVDNMMMAMRPQLTHAYALKDNNYLEMLLSRGTRFSFFLMSLLCVPLVVNARHLLALWLGEVPPFTVEFVQITVIYLMVIPFSSILDTLQLATGNIKRSQVTLSFLQLLNIPLSCVLLYAGLPPYSIYLSYMVISYISLYYRLKFVVENTDVTYRFYVKSILLPVFIAMGSAILAIMLLKPIITVIYFWQLIVWVLVIEILLCSTIWLCGVNHEERRMVILKIKGVLIKR